MTKLLVFDLDMTLAPLGEGIGEEELKLFRQLESEDVRIAISSGKTCDYLCGFLRQVGLKNPIMVGENGADIRFGVDLPPKRHYKTPVSEDAEKSLRKVREILEEEFPHIWFQPNQVAVTPFPTTTKEFERIESILREHKEKLKDVEVFRHIDSFDIVPAGMDKAKGLCFLMKVLKLSKEEVIAIGDGTNDYAMFAAAGYSIGVNVKEEHLVNVNCKSTKEMLKYINDFIK